MRSKVVDSDKHMLHFGVCVIFPYTLNWSSWSRLFNRPWGGSMVINVLARHSCWRPGFDSPQVTPISGFPKRDIAGLLLPAMKNHTHSLTVPELHYMPFSQGLPGLLKQLRLLGSEIWIGHPFQFIGNYLLQSKWERVRERVRAERERAERYIYMYCC